MTALEEELYEDLAYEDPEGMSELYEDEMEGFEYFDEDEFAEEDFYEDAYEDEAYFEDEFEEEFDEMEDYAEDFYDAYEDESEDAFDDMMAMALDAEDADEFLGKIGGFLKRAAKGAVRLARKAAPVIGKVARVAAPILSKIPIPQAQIAGRVAGLLGRLRAEGASEEEALEAVAEIAARDKRALPIVAGLTARTILKSKGARMSHGARKKVVKDMKTAAKTLVRKQGPKAIRALPKIAKSVKRTSMVKGTPVKATTTIVKRTAAKVAASPRMTRKLAKPSPVVRRLIRRGFKGKSYTIPGPARVSITML